MRALRDGLDGFELQAVTSGSEAKAQAALRELNAPVPVVTPKQLADRCDLVVECAPTKAFREIAIPVLSAGRQLLTVSGAALIGNMDVVDLARAKGGRIILATGALLGLDAVRAAAEGQVHSVDVITRKPPKSLVGAPHLIEHGIEVEALTEPLKVFEGSAYDLLGRLIQEDYGELKAIGKGDVVRIYDESNASNSIGRLTSVRARDFVERFSYDQAGRILAQVIR